MAQTTSAQDQMLHDLMLEDDPKADCWMHFDPPFSRKTIAALLNKGLIEAKDGDQFRLTQAGRVRPNEDMYRAIRDRFRAPGGKPYPDSFFETIWSAMLSAGRFYD